MKLIRFRLQAKLTLAILCSICWIGCNRESPSDASQSVSVGGKVILDVLFPRLEDNLFVVVPSRGTVDKLRGEKKPEVVGGVENCYSAPVVNSPDRNFLASCLGEHDNPSLGAKPDQFRIARGNSEPSVCRGLKGQVILGFLWSPDSKYVAVLTENIRLSVNPRYWLYALSGHPAQFETYYLNIVDAATLKAVAFKVPIETMGGGSAGLVRWEQP